MNLIRSARWVYSKGMTNTQTTTNGKQTTMTEIFNLETIEDLNTQMKNADRKRGHRFIGTEKIPALYATEETKINEKTVAAHYFAGGFDWYVLEFDPTTGTAFALSCTDSDLDGELGYVNLFDLGRTTIQARVNVMGCYETTLEFLIERDCYWTPQTVATIRAAR